MLIPGKRAEDSGTTSEDDGLPCSPPETSFHERVKHRAVYKVTEQQRWKVKVHLKHNRDICYYFNFDLINEIQMPFFLQYPESQKHLSSLSLAGTGSEEEEQVIFMNNNNNNM